jgi:formate dehydrogenase maturation protein FdhE
MCEYDLVARYCDICGTGPVQWRRAMALCDPARTSKDICANPPLRDMVRDYTWPQSKRYKLCSGCMQGGAVVSDIEGVRECSPSPLPPSCLSLLLAP